MGVYKNYNGNLVLIPGTTLFADNPIGTILAYGGATAPKGWFLCQGQAISRTEYSELFSVIGTSFGSGDEITTFNLPDLREATTKGAGLTGLSNNHYDTEGLALGEFIDDRVQNHSHKVYVYATASSGTNYIQGNNGTGTDKYTVYGDANELDRGRHGATTEVKAIGVNYIIKAKQVSVPTDFAGAAEAAGAAAAEEVVALKQNITDNSLQTTAKTVPGAINEVAGHANKIDGNQDYTWIDVPADISASGKMTRAFIHDGDLFLGTQIWTDGLLTKEGKFYFKPTPTQITLLNGVTSTEPANCNIVDYGAFIVVNLANVTIPNDFAQYNYFMQLPAFATARINFTVPTSTGQEIVYIDANTRELRITNKVDQQIFTNMIIPVGSARY